MSWVPTNVLDKPGKSRKKTTTPPLSQIRTLSLRSSSFTTTTADVGALSISTSPPALLVSADGSTVTIADDACTSVLLLLGSFMREAPRKNEWISASHRLWPVDGCGVWRDAILGTRHALVKRVEGDPLRRRARRQKKTPPARTMAMTRRVTVAELAAMRTLCETSVGASWLSAAPESMAATPLVSGAISSYSTLRGGKGGGKGGGEGDGRRVELVRVGGGGEVSGGRGRGGGGGAGGDGGGHEPHPWHDGWRQCSQPADMRHQSLQGPVESVQKLQSTHR